MWNSAYTFLKKNITDDIGSKIILKYLKVYKEIYDIESLNLEVLHDYDEKSNLLVFCLLNKYFIHMKIRPWMMQKKY